jgi:hypothetical protein
MIQHVLQLNDIIKVGRVKYVVTYISYVDNSSKTDGIFDLLYKAKKIVNDGEDCNCKFCLYDNDDENNPLINLCACKGSMANIHFNCLQKWMATKLNIKSNEAKTIKSYNMKSFNCEICKTPYPCKSISQ